ncbi:haspin [Arctopsyche grandis]|uniref:haspin n=1 Tax=Arctopsyche grandis TaxID=121162 RepID=UPI00406D91C8
MIGGGCARRTYSRTTRESRPGAGNGNGNHLHPKKAQTRWTTPTQPAPAYSYSSDEFDKLLHNDVDPDDTFQRLISNDNHETPRCFDPKLNLTYSSSSPISPLATEIKIKKTRKKLNKHNFKSKKREKLFSSDNRNNISNFTDYHLTVESIKKVNNVSNTQQMILECIKETSILENCSSKNLSHTLPIDNSIARPDTVDIVKTPKKNSLPISSTPCKNTSYNYHSNDNDISAIIHPFTPKSHASLKEPGFQHESDLNLLSFDLEAQPDTSICIGNLNEPELQLKNDLNLEAQPDSSISFGGFKTLLDERVEEAINISHKDEIYQSISHEDEISANIVQKEENSDVSDEDKVLIENKISENASQKNNISTNSCESGNPVVILERLPVVVLDRIPIVVLEDLRLQTNEHSNDCSLNVSDVFDSVLKQNESNVSREISANSDTCPEEVWKNDYQNCNTTTRNSSHLYSKTDTTLKNSPTTLCENENTINNSSYISCNTVTNSPNRSIDFKFVTQRRTAFKAASPLKSDLDISKIEHLNPAGPSFILPAGKKWERHLNIIRNMTNMNDTVDHFNCTMHDETIHRGRKYKQTIDSILQQNASVFAEPSFHPNFISGRKSIVKVVGDYTLQEELLSNSGNDTGIAFSRLSISRYDRPSLISKDLEEKADWTDLSARDLVLRRCNQTEPLPFDECYPKRKLQRCWKIGEGVYGEVFLYKTENDPNNPIVMKVIPIEGDALVNGEPQKKFEEIISEIVIAMELSDLRNNTYNNTSSFARVHRVHCVQGSYPERLLTQWDLFDELKGSENDYPNFNSNQLYIVLELEHGGKDLEAFEFSNAEKSYALFFQIAFTLAVAEEAYQFEHRDLHWGNVLIKPTDEPNINYNIRGTTYSIPSCGVFANIIDFTLSRISLPQFASTIYNDLANDDDLFNAGGDYQFSIYRLMREKNGNSWQEFHPYTNILWLHYILTKMIDGLRYERVKSKIHKKYINKLKKLRDAIRDYNSCFDFVISENCDSYI